MFLLPWAHLMFHTFISLPPHPMPVIARNYEAELVHSRWAMLAAIGCLIPEILDLRGVELGEPVWWKVWKPTSTRILGSFPHCHADIILCCVLFYDHMCPMTP